MRRIAGAALLVLATLAGCGGGGDTYTITASFPRAVALYEHSDVKLMGVDIGKVVEVVVMDDHVEVTMEIRADVPLPADVVASIVPLSLIGERNVVLSPAYRPGAERLADGAAIPPDRTRIPVEPDEALQAITDLARAIDPEAVRGLVSNGAAALDGHGQDLNDALREAGDLASLVAAQDDALVAIAADVRELAAVLTARQEVLGGLIEDFASVSDTLAAERESIASFLAALARLTEDGSALLTRYQVQLPEDLAALGRVALTLQVNSGSVQQLVQALDGVGTGVVGAYDAQTGGIRIRFTATPTVARALDPILRILGLPGAPCVPLPIEDTTCAG